jgi:hypothetical protein
MQFWRVVLLAVVVPLGLCGCARAPVAAPRPVIRGADGAVVSELSFPPGRGDVVVPLRAHGTLLMSDDVRINGKSPGAMVIDTGAGWSSIDHSTAKALGIGADEFWKAAPGEEFPDGLYRIDSLDVAGMTLRNHLIGVVDMSSLNTPGAAQHRRIVGVIGADVFAATPFTLDGRNKQLILHRGKTSARRPGRTACTRCRSPARARAGRTSTPTRPPASRSSWLGSATSRGT